MWYSLLGCTVAKPTTQLLAWDWLPFSDSAFFSASDLRGHALLRHRRRVCSREVARPEKKQFGSSSLKTKKNNSKKKYKKFTVELSCTSEGPNCTACPCSPSHSCSARSPGPACSLAFWTMFACHLLWAGPPMAVTVAKFPQAQPRRSPGLSCMSSRSTWGTGCRPGDGRWAHRWWILGHGSASAGSSAPEQIHLSISRSLANASTIHKQTKHETPHTGTHKQTIQSFC